jgi:hypothetical protein
VKRGVSAVALTLSLSHGFAGDGVAQGTARGRPWGSDLAMVGFAVATPAWRELTVGIDSRIARVADPALLSSAIGAATTTLSWERGRGGAWLGAGAERLRAGTVTEQRPAFMGGIWRELRGVIVSVTTARRSARFDQRVTMSRSTIVGYDSVYTDTSGWQRFGRMGTVTDTVMASQPRSWMDSEARLSWERGRVVLDGMLGVRAPASPVRGAMWSAAAATVRLAGPVALTLGAGTRREDVPGPGQVRRFATVSLRLTPGVREESPPSIGVDATPFSAERTEAGRYRVRIRVAGARTVDLSGDFNAWRAIPLVRTGTDVWEATVAATPGSYRVNVRVDGGAWTAPPGTSVVEDEFRGTVGLMVLR